MKQVDHRSIKWIIFKNVKYTLGRKTDDRELPLKPDEGDKWDSSKLSVNNWFSATSYYKVASLFDDQNVMVTEKSISGSVELKMAKDILETEMYSGLAYGSTEKISRTDLVDKLINAGETVFTVNFNKKVDNAHV